MENYTKQIDFKRYSSIKIGDTKDVLVINEIGDYSDFYIVGKANNLLVSPNTDKKFAILGEAFSYIKKEDDLLYVGCATTSGKLLSYCKKNNIANLEFLAKLPGNLGGIVKMNAGLKQWEIFNHIVKIKTKDGYINKEDIEYGYRNTKISDIVYEVVLKVDYGYSKENQAIFDKMRDNQPRVASAGSCFANPKDDFAGRLIEEVGLKGQKKGSMSFSSKHANFLINEGDGTFEDALYLINEAKKRVKEKFGVKLEEEVVIVD